VNNAQWFALVGALLLVMGVTSTLLKRVPVTSAMLYLGVGLLLGPTGLDAFRFNPLRESPLLEVLTEVAVLISLFSAGVKMPVPFALASWRALTPGLWCTSARMVNSTGRRSCGLPMRC
jgi:Kef-type K+ transport system membrane component KefB